MITIKISKEDSDLRIDKYLRKLLVNSSLSNIYKIIRKDTKVNSRRPKENYKLKESDILEIHISKEEFQELTKKEPIKQIKITFKILYEDEYLLIIGKPPYLASQPGTGVEQDNVISQAESYLNKTVYPINRLDRLTSGIMLLAKDRKTANILYTMSRNNELEKHYLALVKGNIKESGIIKNHLKRITENFQHKVIISKESEGKLAVTEFKPIKNIKDFTLLELKLKTGRMHQIRAQLNNLGNPIIGDDLYGDKELNKRLKIKRQLLHAFRLVFKHPVSSKILEIKSDPPDDFKVLTK